MQIAVTEHYTWISIRKRMWAGFQVSDQYIGEVGVGSNISYPVRSWPSFRRFIGDSLAKTTWRRKFEECNADDASPIRFLHWLTVGCHVVLSCALRVGMWKAFGSPRQEFIIGCAQANMYFVRARLGVSYALFV